MYFKAKLLDRTTGQVFVAGRTFSSFEAVTASAERSGFIKRKDGCFKFVGVVPSE
jgi:hypothetical protein